MIMNQVLEKTMGEGPLSNTGYTGSELILKSGKFGGLRFEASTECRLGTGMVEQV